MKSQIIHSTPICLKTYCFIIFFLIGNLNLNAQQMSISLKVGDTAPEFKAFKWIKGTPVKKFEVGKIYLVEFGATWCKPCAAAIPELSAIADQHHQEVEVISMFVMESNTEPLSTPNPVYVKRVEKYVAKRTPDMRYSVAVDNPQKDMETSWLQAAGKIGVPYMFVVDRNGKIACITSSLKEVRKTIVDCINNRIVKFNADEKREFDQAELLLVDGNGGDDKDFLFRSILTRYDGQIRTPNPQFVENFGWAKPGSIYDKQYKDRFQIIGASIADLYYMAYGDTVSNVVHFRGPKWEFPDTISRPHLRTSYGKFWFKPMVEVDDKTPFISSHKSALNRYNYSLKVPPGTGTAWFLQKALQNDLKTYFGYNVKVEVRQMPCWVISIKDEKLVQNVLLSKDESEKLYVMDTDIPFVFKNAIMQDVITMMAATFGYGLLDYGRLPPEEQAPFIDETGIKKKIDFEFDKRLSFVSIREYLNTLGLEIKKVKRPMKVVVVRDPEKE